MLLFFTFPCDERGKIGRAFSSERCVLRAQVRAVLFLFVSYLKNKMNKTEVFLMLTKLGIPSGEPETGTRKGDVIFGKTLYSPTSPPLSGRGYGNRGWLLTMCLANYISLLSYSSQDLALYFWRTLRDQRENKHRHHVFHQRTRPLSSAWEEHCGLRGLKLYPGFGRCGFSSHLYKK